MDDNNKKVMDKLESFDKKQGKLETMLEKILEQTKKVDEKKQDG